MQIRLLVDKVRTVFAHDDNEHHMRLKIGLNRWENIVRRDLKKVTEVRDAGTIYAATIDLPEELFEFEFVVEDARSGKARAAYACSYVCLCSLHCSVHGVC